MKVTRYKLRCLWKSIRLAHWAHLPVHSAYPAGPRENVLVFYTVEEYHPADPAATTTKQGET